MDRFSACVCLVLVYDSALLTKFFPETAFRTAALECLTEIAGLVDLDPRYNTLFQNMFVVLVKQVSNSTKLYKRGSRKYQVVSLVMMVIRR